MGDCMELESGECGGVKIGDDPEPKRGDKPGLGIGDVITSEIEPVDEIRFSVDVSSSIIIGRFPKHSCVNCCSSLSSVIV